MNGKWVLPPTGSASNRSDTPRKRGGFQMVSGANSRGVSPSLGGSTVSSRSLSAPSVASKRAQARPEQFAISSPPPAKAAPAAPPPQQPLPAQAAPPQAQAEAPPPAQQQAEARTEGQARYAARKAAAARKALWGRRLVGRVVPWIGGLLVLGGVLSLPQALFPNVSRAAAAGTRLAADVGTAVGQVTSAGANVTVLAAEVTELVTRGSINLMAEAWRGVDLHDVKATQESGLVYAVSALAFEEYATSEDGRVVLGLTSQQVAFVLKMLTASSWRVPRVARSTQFAANNSFVSFEVEVRLMADGYFAIHWVMAAINFTARWANPLWDACEFDVMAEYEAVVERVKNALRAQARRPDFSATAWTPAEAAGLPVHGEHWLSTLWREWRGSWRRSPARTQSAGGTHISA